jgi:hypothetical protein
VDTSKPNDEEETSPKMQKIDAKGHAQVSKQ